MKRMSHSLIVLATCTLPLFLPFSVIANDIYEDTRVGQGNSLNLHAYPSAKSKIQVAIPHNASWVVKRKQCSL